MKIKLPILLLVLAILGTTACTDDSTLTESTSDNAELNRFFTPELLGSDIGELGELHNEYSIRVIENMDWEAKDISKEMYQEFLSLKESLNLPDIEVSLTKEMPDINEHVSSLDEYSEAFNDIEKFKSNYSELMLLSEITFDQYSDLALRVEELDSKAKKELSKEDYFIFSGAKSVFLSSSKLWTAVNQGGLGYADIIKSKLGLSNTKGGPCGNGAALADTAAATNYIVWTAVTCLISAPICASIAATGVGVAVYIGGWAFSSAMASATAYLYCVRHR